MGGIETQWKVHCVQQSEINVMAPLRSRNNHVKTITGLYFKSILKIIVGLGEISGIETQWKVHCDEQSDTDVMAPLHSRNNYVTTNPGF